MEGNFRFSLLPLFLTVFPNLVSVFLSRFTAVYFWDARKENKSQHRLFVLSGLPAKLLLTRFQRFLLFRLPFSHHSSHVTRFAIARRNSHVHLANTFLSCCRHAPILLCIRLIFSSKSTIGLFLSISHSEKQTFKILHCKEIVLH